MSWLKIVNKAEYMEQWQRNEKKKQKNLPNQKYKFVQFIQKWTPQKQHIADYFYHNWLNISFFFAAFSWMD